jgi:hypothetical protein
MKRKFLSLAFGLALLGLADADLSAQSLRGSPTSVNRIYRQAVNHDLRFYPSATAIRTANTQGTLVRLAGNANYTLVDVSYPYVLPPVQTFVNRLASQYRSACGEQLVVTSAMRPTSMRLANSVDKSVHPTGMAVDLRKPRNSRCLSWLRNTLSALEAGGVLDAVEERNPAHFHVAIFPSQYNRYVQGRSGGSATTRLVSTSAPAAASSGSATSQSYRVRSGDSLWTIARKNNTTVNSLKEANDLRTSTILAGQVLRIPLGR